MLKKIGVIILAIMLLSGIITGCASPSGDNNNPKQTQNPTEAPNEDEEKEAVSITYWMTPPGEEATRAWWEKWISEYNSTNDNNVTINFEFVPNDAYDSKLKAAQATGTAPQLAYVNHASAIKGSVQKLYMPINDYIDMSKLDDIYDNVRDMITVDGKVYSIPMYVEPYSVLFYRKDLFEAAGLDPNAPPKTWAQLMDYAKQLTTADTFGLGIAGSGDSGWVNWGWQAALGLNYIDEDWSKATVNNDISKQFLQFHKDLYDANVVPKQPLSAFWDIQPLVEGRLAMQFNGSWAISRILVDFKDTIDPAKIGIALPPTIDGIQDGDNVAALGGYALAIDGKAKNPQEVADFISYLLLDNPEIMAEFISSNYYAKNSVRKSVDEVLASKSENKVDEWFNLLSTKVIPFSKPEPIYPWEIDVAFVNAMDNVIVNGMDIDKALEECEKEINDYITNNNLAGTNPRK